MELVADGDLTMLKITPPQTKDGRVGATKGAYCFVIDVSGSMNAAAEVTNDDGDRVSHGWSQLDIAKHATNTFITSLEDDDLVSVVTYSDGAKTLLEWTRCDAAGKTRAEQAVDSMRPERSTNLMAGINSGFQQMQQIPEPDTAMHECARAAARPRPRARPLTSHPRPHRYALNLIIATDGMPSPQWHPARGRDGYLPLVKMNLKKLLGARGETSRCVLTTIGLGNQLDSELLLQMSNMFLHMPDPGSVGPFMVNLLANLRSTARLPDPAGGSAANHINLVVSPASAVDPASLVGYGKRAEVTTLPGIEGQVLAVELGSLTFDQPRHLVFKMSGAAEFTLTQHEKAVTKLSSAATPVRACRCRAHSHRVHPSPNPLLTRPLLTRPLLRFSLRPPTRRSSRSNLSASASRRSTPSRRRWPTRRGTARRAWRRWSSRSRARARRTWRRRRRCSRRSRARCSSAATTQTGGSGGSTTAAPSR